MNKWILFRFCLLFPWMLFSELSPFTLITMPKGGSHLCIKALHQMTESPAVWHTYFPSSRCIPPEKGFLYTHFCLSKELEEHYQKLPQLKKIIAIRDLRDVTVSIVSQIKKAPWPGMDAKLRKHFLALPFDEQLFFVMNYEYDIHVVAKTAPNSNQVSLIRIVEQVLEYMKDSNNLIIRYEHLVGAEGGGSMALQINELRKISEFIGANLSDHKLYDIASKLYGNFFDPFTKGDFVHFQSTFAKGKIGSWKEVFTEEHKSVFKEKFGEALIELGYEQDMNW